MARIATKNFKLLGEDGETTSYAVGDMIAPAHEGHWYAQAHSDETAPPEQPKAKRQKAEKPADAPASDETAPPEQQSLE